MLWLLLLDNLDCADPGVVALHNLGSRSFLAAVTSVGVFLSVDRLMVSASLLFRAWRTPTRFRVFPVYEPADKVLLLWNIFTCLSVIVVATTARSHLSVVFKTLHVIVEASLLGLVLWHHQLRRLASVVASSVVVIWFLVLVYPCGESVDWAESAGLVLDSVNFLAHLLVWARQPQNRDLRLTVRGLGLHAIYLVLYLVANDLDRFVDVRFDDTTKATLRVLGMTCNIAAVYVFVRLERARLLPPSGDMTLGEWKALGAEENRVLWNGGGVCLIENGDKGELVPLHEPHETAYVRDTSPACPWSFPNATRPVDENGLLSYCCIFPCAERERSALPPDDSTQVHIRSFAARDWTAAAVSVVCGLVLWAM